MAVDYYNEQNVVTNNWVKWTKVDNRIEGTLVSVKQQPSKLPNKRGQMETVYEIKADGGLFHDILKDKTNGNVQIIEPPIEIKSGEFWFVSKDSIDKAMRNIKIGQKIAMKLVEIVPSKQTGYDPFKHVKVYAPKGADGEVVMDKEWLEQREAESEVKGTEPAGNPSDQPF